MIGRHLGHSVIRVTIARTDVITRNLWGSPHGRRGGREEVDLSVAGNALVLAPRQSLPWLRTHLPKGLFPGINKIGLKPFSPNSLCVRGHDLPVRRL